MRPNQDNGQIIYLATPQDHIKKVSFRNRLLAFTTDLLAVSILKKISVYFYARYIGNFLFPVGSAQYNKLMIGLESIDLFLFSLIFVGYFTSAYYFSEGKSIGKLLFKSKVFPMGTGEHHLTLSQSFKRSIGYLVCLLSSGILFLLPLLRHDRRGIPDFLSETIVGQEFQETQKLIEEEQSEKLSEAA